MVEESIDGIDAADGRRLPPNSPWLRVVSGAGFVCGLAGLRVANFWPRQKQGYAQADSTFLHFLPFIFATKVLPYVLVGSLLVEYMCNLRVARPVSGQREHRSTGAQAEAER